jgi:phosphoglycerate dehydrogenase-like enzyme
VLVTAGAFKETPGEGHGRLIAAGCTVTQAARRGPLPAAELLAALSGRDAVIASTDPYTDAVLAASPRLKIISRWGVGLDSIDLAAATRHGVVVAYTPGRTTDAVADYAMGLLLAAARRIPEGYVSARAGRWEEFRGVGLPGKVLGLVGFGSIGRAVAKRAQGFELKVLAADPAARPPLPGGVELVELDTLLARSDFVSLHAALTPSTRGLIGKRALSLMKPTAYLINTARGGLIDEEALVETLRERRITGAALDVTVTEPAPPDHPFRSLPGCLLTPHNAFNSQEAAVSVSEAAAGAVLRLLSGEPPPDVANPEVLESPALRAALKRGEGGQGGSGRRPGDRRG